MAAAAEEKGEKKASRSSNSNVFVSAAFLLGSASIGFLAGFGQALAATKKANNTSGLAEPRVPSSRDAARVHAEGVALASRALARGSLYAVAGSCGVAAAIWLLAGCPNSFFAFRQTVATVLPVIPRKEPKEGERIDFDGVRDLIEYLVQKDQEAKDEEKAKSVGVSQQ